tara:strand:+ start:434 stop:634 length:201 start_codon:yes stop_codon:yes gene_type:complete
VEGEALKFQMKVDECLGALMWVSERVFDRKGLKGQAFLRERLQLFVSVQGDLRPGIGRCQLPISAS